MYWGLDYPPLTAYHSWICGFMWVPRSGLVLYFWVMKSTKRNWFCFMTSNSHLSPPSSLVIVIIIINNVPSFAVLCLTWVLGPESLFEPPVEIRSVENSCLLLRGFYALISYVLVEILRYRLLLWNLSPVSMVSFSLLFAHLKF